MLLKKKEGKKMLLLQTQFVSSVQHSFLVFSPTQTQATFRIAIKSEKASESSSDDSAPTNSGVGFGSSDTAALGNSKRKQKQKQKQKGQRERASIIRRTPLEKPPFVSEQQAGKAKEEESKNESAFLLAWLGFGVVILVEGISLAASGFLPEQWDQFLVKYLYPSFTPTVFLFVAGAVAYGVLKYLQNENITQQK
ncbi:Protein LOW PSII ACCUMULATION 2, chloroplastic, partial [Mucuna pruriens]